MGSIDELVNRIRKENADIDLEKEGSAEDIEGSDLLEDVEPNDMSKEALFNKLAGDLDAVGERIADAMADQLIKIAGLVRVPPSAPGVPTGGDPSQWLKKTDKINAIFETPALPIHVGESNPGSGKENAAGKKTTTSPDIWTGRNTQGASKTSPTVKEN